MGALGPRFAWPPPTASERGRRAPIRRAPPRRHRHARRLGARRDRPASSRRRPRNRPPACCRADGRSWPTVAWPPPTAPRAARAAETTRLVRPGGRQGRRAAIRHAPPRRHRQERCLAHVLIGLPVCRRRLRSRTPGCCPHQAFGTTIADRGPVGTAAADRVRLQCETGPPRAWTLSARGSHGRRPSRTGWKPQAS